MIINHNMSAMNAHRNMTTNTNAANKSMEKLSSGLRINRAGDDAAGLAISEKMRGQIRGLDQASRNAQDGISMVQTAEGALNETHNILQRMRELSVQAGTDTNTVDDREEIQKEIEQLKSEIDRIGNNTEFNTQKLLNGNKAGETATEGIKIGDKVIDEVTTPAAAATEGVTTVDVNDINEDITIGSKTFTAGTDFTDVATLVAAINNDTDLKSSITASEDATGKLVLTNKSTGAGSEAVKVTGDGATVDSEVNGTDAVEEVVTTRLATDAEIAANAAGIRDAKAEDVTTTDGKITLQVGANEGQVIELEINDMRAGALGVEDLDVTTKQSASESITTIDEAIKKVSAERSKLGAVQNRLEYTTSNLDNTAENLQSAESRIRDVDMAEEMSTYSKNNILQQAAQAMLAQAKSQPEGVLQLLR